MIDNLTDQANENKIYKLCADGNTYIWLPSLME